MKRIFFYLILSVFLIAFFSCQEVYVNDSLDASLKIPVVEGIVTNGTGPFFVLLYYARPYYDKSRTGISGATVYLKDDLENIYFFKESSIGAYKSEPQEFKAVIGRSYTLFAELPDGTLLKSDAELLRDTLRIQKIIKRKETREDYYRNYDNQIVIRNIYGEANYAVIDSNYSQKAFYRVTSTYNVYSSYTGSSFTYKTIIVNGIPYEFVITTDTITQCSSSYSENTLPKIGSFSPGGNLPDEERMQLSFFILSPDNYINPGFVNLDSSLFTYIYTISQEAYDYYESISKQLSATSRLFDPLPTQLVGNMHCISDSNQVVLGFFEASSHTVYKTRPYSYAGGCIDSVTVSIAPVITDYQ
jgi:hypothetical protein